MSDELPTGFLQLLATDGPDAVVYADREGKIRFWNASATRIFGYEPDEALGQTLDSDRARGPARPPLGGLSSGHGGCCEPLRRGRGAGRARNA